MEKGLQPVAYLSWGLNRQQSHYPTFEQELLALFKVFEEWQHYLLPLHFIARTDHNWLKFLKTQPSLNERQFCWPGMARFAEFHFDLHYRHGPIWQSQMHSVGSHILSLRFKVY
eukprot:135978-Rhodomonas_salina.1